MAKQLATAVTFETLLAPIKHKRKPAVANAFLPWLAKHASAELGRWNVALTKQAVRAGYRNALFAATTLPLSKAIAIDDDGCRAARIRSLFVGASPILEDAEELWLATWAPTPAGTSQVWASHQDERELELLDESIADFVLRQYREDSYFNDPDDANAVTLPPTLAALKVTTKRTKLPKLLGPADLQARTDWIVAQFFPEGDWYGIGDGIDGMPPFAAYQKDMAAGRRGLVQQWPHHQAYWLLHHLAVENLDALAQLLPLVERTYPPNVELAAVAKRVLAKQALPAWWPAKSLAGFRAVLRDAMPAAFEKDLSPAQKRAANNATGMVAAAKRAAAALAKGNRHAAAALADLELAATGAGDLNGFEQALIKAEFADDKADLMSMFLRAKRGNAPMLQNLLRSLVAAGLRAVKKDKNASAVLARYATSLIEIGAAFDEHHTKATFGAIALLGATTTNFAALQNTVAAYFGAVDQMSRLRRLEMAAVAEQLLKQGKDAAALAFLQSEAKRFVAQINEWETDTAMLPFAALLRLKDIKAMVLLADMMRTAEFSGSNRTTLLAIITFFNDNQQPAAAPALRSAFERKFGRASDGERALLAQALAKCDGALAAKVLAAAVVKSSSLEERAAAYAGLLNVPSASSKHVGAARKLLQQVDPADEIGCGVGLSLLRAALQSPAKARFAAELKTWQAAKLSKHASQALVAWLNAA